MACELPLLGRRRFAAGRETALAQGNSVVTSDVRGGKAAYPGRSDRDLPADGVENLTPPSLLNRSTYARPFQNGRLIARDRHIVALRGRTVTSPKPQDPVQGANPNPEADGPSRPGYEMVNRTESFQIGTDLTRNLDNNAVHASVMAGTRRFPLGNQGSTPFERVYGGTPGLYRPYGARGFVEGPEPVVYSLPGGPGKANVIVEDGSPADGPQLVSGGAPHGLHSPTMFGTKMTMGRRNATVQMKHGRQQRPAGSKIAGQSYSQTVQHQDGSGGGEPPRLVTARQAGITGRFVRRR